MPRCLIVDDKEENVYFLRVLLEKNGYQVDCATNGAEALEKGRTNPPDLIISDILMPVMDGFSLCREWRKDDHLKTIPIIIYTATYTDSKDRDFALSLGADRFLIKPLEPEVLLEEISTLIQRKTSETKQHVVEDTLQESVFLKQYNEALIRKLESKMLLLEQKNESLRKEIGDRKTIEKELRESKGWLSTMLNTIWEAIFAVEVEDDDHYHFTSINQAFCDMTELTEEEIKGKQLNEVIFGPSLPIMLEKCKQAIKTKSAVKWEATPGYPGRQLTWEMSISPVFDDEGQCTCLIGSIHDISERKLAVEEIKKLNGDLERRIDERTTQLNEKITQLEEMNRVFVGREIKMAELKERIAKLEKSEVSNGDDT
jgi:PAS domain S-box-containing protein